MFSTIHIIEKHMNNKLYLYGASGHAKVIRDIVEACGDSVVGLFDDNFDVNEFQDLAVAHHFCGESPVMISIGSNRVRKHLANTLRTTFSTVVHPSAIISKRAIIGEGSVIMQGAIIQSEAKIGKHCIINTGASIDHECRIENYVHVSPHSTLCGNVTVGEGTWIGAGTTVIQGIKIGRWCMIGAGSVVTKDIPDGYLAVGNRCKLIKQINHEMLSDNAGGVSCNF